MDLNNQLLRIIQDVSMGTEVYEVDDKEMFNLMYKEIEAWQQQNLFSLEIVEEFKNLPPNKVLLAHEKIQQVLSASEKVG